MPDLKLFSWRLVVWVLLAALGAVAPVSADEDALNIFAQELDAIERGLQQPLATETELKLWSSQISAGRSLAHDCVTEGDKARIQLEEDLASLGEAVADEPGDVTRKRNEVSQAKSRLHGELAGCRLLVLRSDELNQAINLRLKSLLAQKLSARGPNIGVLLLDNWNEPVAWLSASGDFLRDRSGITELQPAEWVLLAGMAVIGFVLGVLVRRHLLRSVVEGEWGDDLPGRFSRALVSSAGHYAPQLLAGVGAVGVVSGLTHDIRPVPFISVALYGLLIYFIVISVIRLFLAPRPPAALFIDIPGNLARPLARRLKVLVLLAYVGLLLFYTLLSQSLPESAFLLARGIFAAILILNLVWALWLVMRLPRLAEVRGINWIVNLVLIGALVAEWAGYRNLSVTALRILIGTAIAGGIGLFFGRLFRDFYDALDEGGRGWASSIRNALSLKETEHFPGLMWVRITTVMLLWGGVAVAVLRIWGASDNTLNQIRLYFVDGFEVGSLPFVPLRILMAVISLAVLVAVAGWIRARLDSSWLRHSRMERGAREAMVTISGYLLITIAVLVGLGIAGVDFSNLAIIAGALSVGIGFGLQNIVNNFVSGLILLFERPIKTGDWVVVGNTEGYVKRIRIRSTQIQTFDRADVIVPNSELISNQVTNWMLYDMRGRVRVPVGVAYGSDTEKVRDILLKVAEDNPEVINDGSAPVPRALFRTFGDSALEFELRCHIHNIDDRIRVMSDINFAIDKAFREAGVEIPFPQRDLHLRSWDPDAGPPHDAPASE